MNLDDSVKLLRSSEVQEMTAFRNHSIKSVRESLFINVIFSNIYILNKHSFSSNVIHKWDY